MHEQHTANDLPLCTAVSKSVSSKHNRVSLEHCFSKVSVYILNKMAVYEIPIIPTILLVYTTLSCHNFILQTFSYHPAPVKQAKEDVEGPNIDSLYLFLCCPVKTCDIQVPLGQPSPAS